MDSCTFLMISQAAHSIMGASICNARKTIHFCLYVLVCPLRCPFTVHFSSKCHSCIAMCMLVYLCVIVGCFFFHFYSHCSFFFILEVENSFLAGFFGCWDCCMRSRSLANSIICLLARSFVRLRVLYNDYECKCDELVFEWNGFGIVSITTTTVISAVSLSLLLTHSLTHSISSYVIGRCFCSCGYCCCFANTHRSFGICLWLCLVLQLVDPFSMRSLKIPVEHTAPIKYICVFYFAYVSVWILYDNKCVRGDFELACGIFYALKKICMFVFTCSCRVIFFLVS